MHIKIMSFPYIVNTYFLIDWNFYFFLLTVTFISLLSIGIDHVTKQPFGTQEYAHNKYLPRLGHECQIHALQQICDVGSRGEVSPLPTRKKQTILHFPKAII